jgi:hypothetical protein
MFTDESFASPHLRSLNVSHFGMVEANGLKTMAYRLSSMA